MESDLNIEPVRRQRRAYGGAHGPDRDQPGLAEGSWRAMLPRVNDYEDRGSLGDEQLWVRMAEAFLARGRSFSEAMDAADRVLATYWRNRAMCAARLGGGPEPT